MLKPASLFTDGAVLCRRKEIRIFGEAPDGAEVMAILSDRRGMLLAENTGLSTGGRFTVLLPPQEAQTGCCLILVCGDEQVTAENVAIGEVFLAGGQSNMELELRNADEGPEVIRTHRDPLLRFYNVPRMACAGEEQRKAAAETRWQAISPGSGGGNSAVAYFFAAALRKRFPDIPVGIIGCYWGGTSITCWMEEETLRATAEGARYLDEYAEQIRGKAMEAWQAEEDAFQKGMNRWNRQVELYRQQHPDDGWPLIEKACGQAPWNPPPGPGSPYRPGGLAESMLTVAAPATLTGILYYQGEEDAAKTDQYDLLMITLIRRWRELFRDAALPFLFVQLPMWIDYGAEDTFRWPVLRQAQAKARDAVRNTGMVCLLDMGEYGNIHPTCKRPVGERLAELAGSLLYGKGETSPRAAGKYTEGETMTILLSGPVTVRGGGEAKLLEIAGEDRQYAPAKAVIQGNKLLLRAEGVQHPVHARYAWTDWSDRVNLFGTNGLPLEPFDL